MTLYFSVAVWLSIALVHLPLQWPRLALARAVPERLARAQADGAP